MPISDLIKVTLKSPRKRYNVKIYNDPDKDNSQVQISEIPKNLYIESSNNSSGNTRKEGIDSGREDEYSNVDINRVSN